MSDCLKCGQSLHAQYKCLFVLKVAVLGNLCIVECHLLHSYFSVLSEDVIIDSDAIAIDFGKQVSGTVFGGALAILVVS